MSSKCILGGPPKYKLLDVVLYGGSQWIITRVKHEIYNLADGKDWLNHYSYGINRVGSFSEKYSYGSICVREEQLRPCEETQQIFVWRNNA